MKRRTLVALCVLACLLILVGLFQQDEKLELTPTSYGTIPTGFGAVFDLLNELKYSVARNRKATEKVDISQALWLLSPQQICAPSVDQLLDEDRKSRLMRPTTWNPRSWFEQGGVAVVALSEYVSCSRIAGFELTAVSSLYDDEGEEPGDDPRSLQPEDALQVNYQLAAERPRGSQVVAIWEQGEFAFPGLTLRSFADPGDFKVVAWVDKEPFIVERQIGEGRLVVIADVRPFQNAWLDSGDAAPFAVSLVKAYGAPLFDEFYHGMPSHDGFFATLIATPARYFAFGFLLWGVIWIWSGFVLPARKLSDGTIRAPTLDVFVDSMANLYAQTRDYKAVLDRYRELCASNIRRRFALPADVSFERILERVQYEKVRNVEGMQILTQGTTPRSEAALARDIEKLDALLKEIVA